MKWKTNISIQNCSPPGVARSRLQWCTSARFARNCQAYLAHIRQHKINMAPVSRVHRTFSLALSLSLFLAVCMFACIRDVFWLRNHIASPYPCLDWWLVRLIPIPLPMPAQAFCRWRGSYCLNNLAAKTPVGESGAKWACGAKWAPSI